MNQLSSAVVLVAAIAWATIAPTTLAQLGSDDMTPEEQAEAAKLIQELAQPGPEHELLEKLAGQWNTVTTFQLAPDQPPVSFEGSTHSRLILGGRFLEVRSESEVMGQRTESLAIMGFDRRYDHYTVVGFDMLGTYYVTGAGTLNPEDGGIRLEGVTHNPKLNHTENYYFLIKIEDDQHHTTEVWFEQAGGEFRKAVTMEASRVEE